MTFVISGGRILRDGQPFVAVGADYHPSRAGCRIWTDWDPAALSREFEAIAQAGLNTVRFYVFWRDFEPEPGRYRRTLFSRLRQTVAMAGEAGLVCVVSLLTIWMNGQRLDLPWRQGRSLWRDPEMLARQAGFAREAGAALAGLGNVLAVDLGDEIAHVEPGAASSLSRGEVAAWQEGLAGVLRECLPGAFVIQANDVSGALGSSPFGVDNADALDMIAIHGFPTWFPGSVESTGSYKATNVAPFLARFAGAYGPPFIDELGSYGVDEAGAAAYLRASAASALANGAVGVVAWCWQDIASSEQPYRDRPNERHVGLCRLDGTSKPALAEFTRVANAAARLARRRQRAPIALYVPERARAAHGSYLDSGAGTLATFFAYLLLKRAHLDFDVLSGELDGYQLVICPSVSQVTMSDLERMHTYLRGGGTLYYSMGDHLHGFPGSDLAGAEIVDYSLLPEGKVTIRWDGDEWPLDWDTGAARPTTVKPTTAHPVAFYLDGTPAMLANRVGRGRVLFCTAPFERQLDRPGRLTGSSWEGFYRRVAELAGVRPPVDCDDPDVEIVPDGAAGPAEAVVINHGQAPARTELLWRGAPAEAPASVPLRLGAKDWCIARRA